MFMHVKLRNFQALIYFVAKKTKYLKILTGTMMIINRIFEDLKKYVLGIHS
jgi:hypothetical protein